MVSDREEILMAGMAGKKRIEDGLGRVLGDDWTLFRGGSAPFVSASPGMMAWVAAGNEGEACWGAEPSSARTGLLIVHPSHSSHLTSSCNCGEH
jgi:hypothetical protein